MAGTRDTYRIARLALTALAATLLVSIAISYLIGASKLSTAESAAEDTARVLVQENLSGYVDETDLVAPVGESRARDLDDLIDGTVLNGEIDAVTIWEPDGTIVFSSDADLIGTRLPEERFPLREVLKTGTDSAVQDGMFSTRVPLAPEGTDVEAVAQLDRVYAPIWNSTAKPWRTASLAMSLVLLLVLGAIYQVSRMASRRWKVVAGTTFHAIRGRRPAQEGDHGTGPASTQPDLRAAEEALSRAEVRATTAEERAAALHEQYRKTLEELHAAQTKLEGAALETPSRPDPEIEERLLKAEGRVRLLEGQLQSVKAERDKLASDAQEHPAGTAPDPKIEERARAAETEVASLRSELDTARHEVAAMVKELESARREREQLADRGAEAGRLEALLAEATTEVDRSRSALATAEGELETARADLETARLTTEAARAAEARAEQAERRAAALEDRARSLETDLAQARAGAEGRVDEAQAAAERAITEARTRAEQAEARIHELEQASAARTAEAADAAAAEIAAARRDAASEVEAAQARAAAEIETARAAAAEQVRVARDAAEAATARRAQIEAAATGDVEAAVAHMETAKARAAELEQALEAARREAAAARAEAESFRATAGTERAELEDAFRAELTAREQDLRLTAEAAEAELRREAEAREQQVRAEAEARVHDLADRLSDAEAAAAAAGAREQQLVGHLEARDHDLAAMRTREAELLAEMAAAQQEAHAAIDAKEQEIRSIFAAEQSASFATLQAATEADRTRFETDRAEMEAREAALRAETEELRSQLEAAVDGRDRSSSELAVALADVQSMTAEADGAKAELRAIWSELESAQQELTTALDQVASTRSELSAAHAELQTLRDGSETVDDALRSSQEETERLRRELVEAREDLARTQAEVRAELDRAEETTGRVEGAERELQEASMRAAAAEHELEQLHREMEITGHELTTLREIAENHAGMAQEREALEEMLRVTQERLNGSNDRVTEVERRAAAAEQALAATREESEEVQARLRQIEMSQAVRGMRREDEPTGAEGRVAVGDPAPIEDRRASTPFMKELSLDAKKTLTSILGLSLTLKHKNQPKEQAPLLRQLAAYARRLDHTVADLLDADRLARGEVDLHPRRTDLEALVERVVEESQAGNDHDLRLQTERIVAAVDPVRTEQILMGLLRGATDRTPLGSAITVRLAKGEGGALISVEDMETSSDASLSPVVARFADVQGGWAKVESRPNGGSAFRVFLPAEGIMPDSPAEEADPEIELSVSAPRTDLEIVVSEELDEDRALAKAADDDDPWAAGQLLVQELQKLSRDD